MNKQTLKKITTVGMLTAVTVILGYFAFPIFPQVPFLEYDLCDVAVLITSFSFGPIYAVASSLVVAIVQAFLLDKSGLFGFIMNVISTCSLILPASILYFRRKTKKSAIIALVVGCVTMSAVMVGFNYIVTPYFMGMPVSAIGSVMPFIVLFNLIKATVNSIITFFIYKHINRLIKKI